MKLFLIFVLFLISINVVIASSVGDETGMGLDTSISDGTCGNSVCDATETCSSCSLDCSCSSGYHCASDTCVQDTSGGSGGSGSSNILYQCKDKIDNDQDGLCDFNGCYIGGIKYSPDTDCDSYYDDSEAIDTCASYTDCIQNASLKGCTYDGCNWCCNNVCTVMACVTIPEENITEQPAENQTETNETTPLEEPSGNTTENQTKGIIGNGTIGNFTLFIKDAYKKMFTVKHIPYFVGIAVIIILLALLLPFSRRSKKLREEEPEEQPKSEIKEPEPKTEELKQKPKEQPKQEEPKPKKEEPEQKHEEQPKIEEPQILDAEFKEFKDYINEADLSIKKLQAVSAKEYLNILVIKKTLNENFVNMTEMFSRLPKTDIVKSEQIPCKQTTVQSYCHTCKKTVDIKDPQRIINQNRYVSIQGYCIYCGKKTSKLIGTIKKHDSLNSNPSP